MRTPAIAEVVILLDQLTLASGACTLLALVDVCEGCTYTRVSPLLGYPSIHLTADKKPLATVIHITAGVRKLGVRRVNEGV